MKSSYNVLFLCTGNSARSIMAEAIMNRKGFPKFRAYSAGSHPSGKVRPEALRQIEQVGLNADGARSKSWDEFSSPNAPQLDFVFTVCDNAANELCPIWPGQPVTAHGEFLIRQVSKALPNRSIEHSKPLFSILDRSISLFLCLPITSLDQMALQRNLDDIGRQ